MLKKVSSKYIKSEGYTAKYNGNSLLLVSPLGCRNALKKKIKKCCKMIAKFISECRPGDSSDDLKSDRFAVFFQCLFQ